MHRGQHLIVYTTEIGGLLKCFYGSWADYVAIRDTGRINIDPAGDIPDWVDMKMVAYYRLVDMRDFVLDPIR